MRRVSQKDLAIISNASWFDADWYAATYPDVPRSGMDPARHYLELGEDWGRWPGPSFSPSDYRDRYPDIVRAGVSPLLHFIEHGEREGRQPRALEAEHLETTLWARQDVEAALNGLESLRASADAMEAAVATWALARWAAWQGDWQRVVDCLTAYPAAGRSFPALGLLTAEALIQTGQLNDAKAGIEALKTKWPDYKDAALVEANYLAACVRDGHQARGRDTDDERLVRLNGLWQAAGLAPVHRINPRQPLTMDNLGTSPGKSPMVRPHPVVTAIVPAHNAETTLPTALSSLAAQHLSALEVLVVDDASTDGSCAVAEAFVQSDPRFRVLVQPTNQGAYAARNRGLREARGAFITVHDSDDWSHPDKLTAQVEALQSHPEWVGCFSHWVRCTTELWFGRWRVEDGWIYRNTSSLMIRREVFDTLGYWDRARVEADTEYALRIMAAYGDDALGEVHPGVPLALGRHLPDSLSQASDTHLVTQFAGWRKSYRDAAMAWHQSASSPGDLYRRDDPIDRPFPLPEAERRDDERGLIEDSGWFDADWYREQNPDVAGHPEYANDPLAHFLRHGAAEGRWPCRAFDPTAYVNAYPDVRASGINPLVHFLRVGQYEQRDPDWQLCEALRETSLMDPVWYLRRYPDVAAAGMDPYLHYWCHGGEEDRAPGPWFDTAFYRGQVEAPITEAPLVHYLRTGRAHGLQPYSTTRVLPDWYARALSDGPLDMTDCLARLPLVPGGHEMPRVLFVLPLESGGTPQANRDLMRRLAADWRMECLLLRCHGGTMQLMLWADEALMPLAEHRLTDPITPFPHQSAEYDAVFEQWLQRYSIDLVHVRHLSGDSLGLYAVARQCDVPVVTSIHDFYALCPSVKLLDEHQRYCAGRCTAGAGECPIELWSDRQMPPLKHAAIGQWQSQFETALSASDALVTTTAATQSTMVARMPRLERVPWRVIPHGRDLAMADCACRPQPSEALRVVLLGHLTAAKGGHLIRALAEKYPAKSVEFHVLGTINPELGLPADVVAHGAFQPGTQNEYIAAIRPHLGAVLSIWPETWCHALTELWAAGLPVVGTDFGAIGERIRQTGAGWVAPSATAEGVDRALRQAHDPMEWTAAHEAVARWQSAPDVQKGTRIMAQSYVALYQSLGLELSERSR